MNKILSLVAFLTLTSATAQANCLGEAQIIAQIASAQAVSSGRCLVTIASKSVRFYNENQICPLSIDEPLAKGVLVRADNFQCSFGENDTLSGIIVLLENDSIVLEQ